MESVCFFNLFNIQFAYQLNVGQPILIVFKNYLFPLQNAYYGATNNMVEYFDAQGITIAEGFNPADFICKLFLQKLNILKF